MKQFKQWIEAQDHGAEAALAKAIGVQPINIWRWKNGKSRPSDERKTKIKELTGIPESAWFEQAEAS